jgi:sulfate transport system permease protein
MQSVLKRKGILPGFGLSLGLATAYLGLVVLIPLSTLFLKAAVLSWADFWGVVTTPRVLASFRLTFLASAAAALINAFFGFITAWVLARYSFPGKRFVDGMVDIPFALPTAVAGIALTAVYSVHGWLGRPLDALGIKAAYAPLGVVIALTFIGLPFVVRTLQPVILEADRDMEEAAATLGATRGQTIRRVLLPPLVPALLTGLGLSFARAVGEYGSVVFISGNMPMRTEIAPLLIVTKLEQFDYTGATAIAVVLLGVSFTLLLVINLVQRMARRRLGEV